MGGCSRTASAASSVILLFVLFGISAAKELLVGGKTDAWKIPSSQSDSLNQWAERSRFQVGDYIVWKYESGKDSVLKVSKGDYLNCNTSKPIEAYSDDGNTKVQLERPGPFYFISGAKGHCEKGQKVIVVVLTPRRSRYTGTSPAPSPVGQLEGGPAIAPSPTSTATALEGGFVMGLAGVFAIITSIWVFLM